MSTDTSTDWEARAEDLHQHAGIPKKRARVVALLEAGRTHAEAADELGLPNRSEVSTHVRRYREKDKSRADWLAEHGPDV